MIHVRKQKHLPNPTSKESRIEISFLAPDKHQSVLEQGFLLLQ